MSQSIKLSDNPETEGFDIQAGETWIYPTNCPIREYQFNIIQKALLKNTLVSLPTGLGKTFIAAVVMYNFYRWYPHGKIIFMAPSKPLVKQQVEACYNIMAIPPEVTAELTGAKVSSARTNIWMEKRVFFVTPQVFQNDLDKVEKLGSKIKCIVFDEAHKARGNYAYCEVIRRLLALNIKHFRVLALSATPGSSVNDVLEVIQNLLISHLEFRTEESLDVQPYVFHRSLETVVVPLGKKLEEIRDAYLRILENHVKTLKTNNIIEGNCGSLTKGKMYMLLCDFKNKTRGTGSSNYSEIVRCLSAAVTLFHAFELLTRHGLRNFLSFFEDKPGIRKINNLKSILANVRDYLGPVPNIEVLPDGTYPEIPPNIKFGHPKFYKLRDSLVSHFTQADKNTKVIVFFEYRESVMEAHILLLQSRPLIQPKIFLGQGSGITQKVQIGVVKAFREGRCNTLLSTCIGEEGLDVGEVDLIICFDISNKSPIRMVQRMGRTGRKRAGRVLVLVTEGKEQQTLKDCLIHKNNISTYVLGSKQLCTEMYQDSPRLVPENVTPRCEKMFMTVKRNNSVKNMLRSVSRNSSEPIFSQDLKVFDLQEKIPKIVVLFNKSSSYSYEKNGIFFKHIEKQRRSQKINKINHSDHTNILFSLLCLADSKRFNIPTQVKVNSQTYTSKSLKQSDIRNMFIKSNSQIDFQALKDISTQVIVKQAEETSDYTLEYSKILKELFTLVSNYLLTQISNSDNKCKHCPQDFKCKDFTISIETSSLTNSNHNVVPSEDILESITLLDLKYFQKLLNPDYRCKEFSFDKTDSFESCGEEFDSEFFNALDFTQLEKKAEIGFIKENNDKSFNFEVPKSYSNLLNKFGESIFGSLEATQHLYAHNYTGTHERILQFFKLDSLSNFFESSSIENSQETVIYSRDDMEIQERDRSSECNTSITYGPPSPILSSDYRKRNLRKTEIYKSTRFGNALFGHLSARGCSDVVINCSTPIKDTAAALICIENNSKTNNLSINVDENIPVYNETKKNVPQIKSIGISELCDLSYFGISSEKTSEDKSDWKKIVDRVDEICDLAPFGINKDVDNITGKNIDEFVFNKPTAANQKVNNQIREVKSTVQDITITESREHKNKDFAVIYNLLLSEQSSTNHGSVLKSNNMNTKYIETKTKMIHGKLKDDTKEIQFTNLTSCSPTKQKTAYSQNLSNKSQVTITQILSCLNTSPQKENIDKNIAASGVFTEQTGKVTLTLTADNVKNCKDLGEFVVRDSSRKKLKLSLNKNICSNNTLPTPLWISRREEIDPYKFVSQQKKSNDICIKQYSSSSDDEFEENPNRSLKPQSHFLNKVKKHTKDTNRYSARKCLKNLEKMKKSNHFLDLEAEVSVDDNVFVSEDENNMDNDCYEKSFVNDEAQNLDTQMHAKYLQSVRSPAIPGRFKIPRRPVLAPTNIFSQQDVSQSDTYIEDSFVINVEDDQLSQQNNLSELEILEEKLKKKRKKPAENIPSCTKRRRVIYFSSDDSD